MRAQTHLAALAALLFCIGCGDAFSSLVNPPDEPQPDDDDVTADDDVTPGDDDDSSDDDAADDDDSTADYTVVFEPDFGRQNQTVEVTATFFDDGGGQVDFTDPDRYFIAGVPDFGEGVFVRKVEIGEQGVQLTLFIDSTAPVGDRRVSLAIDDGEKVLEGSGMFFVLPEASRSGTGYKREHP